MPRRDACSAAPSPAAHVQGALRRDIGPRADQAHVTRQHVQQLRQFVEAGAADDAANTRDAQVVAGRLVADLRSGVPPTMHCGTWYRRGLLAAAADAALCRKNTGRPLSTTIATAVARGNRREQRLEREAGQQEVHQYLLHRPQDVIPPRSARCGARCGGHRLRPAAACVRPIRFPPCASAGGSSPRSACRVSRGRCTRDAACDPGRRCSASTSASGRQAPSSAPVCRRRHRPCSRAMPRRAPLPARAART